MSMVLGLISACSTWTRNEVTTWHQLQPRPDTEAHANAASAGKGEAPPRQTDLSGRRFVIRADDTQKDSLEFRSYAQRVAQELVAQGLVAGDEKDAEVAVRFQYQVDGGRREMHTYPVYGYGTLYPYMYTPYWAGGFYGPGRFGLGVYGGHPFGMYGPYGSFAYGPVGTGVSESTYYTRQLRLQIDEAGPRNPKRLFEGNVVSEGQIRQMNRVVPAMIRALFQDFPGANGETRKVDIRLEDESGAGR